MPCTFNILSWQTAFIQNKTGVVLGMSKELDQQTLPRNLHTSQMR